MIDWYPRTRAITTQLVNFFSQTDTPGERDFGGFLAGLLAEWPYFRREPGNLRLVSTAPDPLERSAVFALARGAGRRALILTGHFDVVGIDCYGPLAAWAADPGELLPRLIALLEDEKARQGDLPPGDALALQDLQSGQFMPGRGALDMKSGLAAAMAVMEAYLCLPEAERPGSLLFVAVPDEEVASHGARAAALQLPDLARQWGLDLAGAINLDCSDDTGDGSQGRAVALGSVGKLLPAVYFVGRVTHAGSPFNGVNASRLAAEMSRLVECNPDLADSRAGEYTAPPVCLHLADTKPRYDVTVPGAAWCYFNWLTLGRPAEEALLAVVSLARQALLNVREDLRQAAGRHSAISGRPAPQPVWTPQVYTFAEVKALAELHSPGFAGQYAALERELAADPHDDDPACALRLTEMAWANSGLNGPAAVVGFAALYYPPASTSLEEPFGAAILRQIQAVGQERGEPITTRSFFSGISDISFLGSRVSESELDVLRANSPAWGARTGFDFSAVARLNLAAVNLGPWGRDYHQRFERVYMPYAFEVVPELLWRIAFDLLGGPDN